MYTEAGVMHFQFGIHCCIISVVCFCSYIVTLEIFVFTRMSAYDVKIINCSMYVMHLLLSSHHN